MKKSFAILLFFVCLCPISGWSQSHTQETLDPEVEKILLEIEKAPADADLRQQLIRRYLQLFEVNLAKLEWVEAKKANRAFHLSNGNLSKFFFLTGSYSQAVHYLQLSYLLNPDPAFLTDLGLAEFARGNIRAAHDYMKMAASDMPGVPVLLMRRYQEYKIHDLPVQADIVLKTIELVFPDQIAILFPVPKIEFISPGKYFPTEAQEINLTFQVSHSRPIKSIKINSHFSYDKRNRRDIPFEEKFSQIFNEQVKLSEGQNLFSVTVEDCFGFSVADTCDITNLRFIRKPEWSSFWSDSLKRSMSLISSYIPDSVLSVQPDPAFRSMIVCGSAYDDSTDFFESGLLFYDLISNQISGRIPEKNNKVLLGKNDKTENIAMAIDKWLIPTTTFQTVSVLFLSGYWEVSEDAWMFEDAEGNGINVKAPLTDLLKIASSGNWVIIDGPCKNRPFFESALQKLAQESSVGTNFCYLPDSVNWKEVLVKFTAHPDTLYNPPDSLNIANTGATLFGFPVFNGGGSVPPPFFFNPAQKTSQVIWSLNQVFDDFLQKEKIKKVQREKLAAFFKSWKYYNELSRFIRRELTLEDLQSRLDEFELRSAKP